MAIFLGLDASTQSITATAIEVEGARGRVLFERAMSYDESLPEYGTRHGLLPSADPSVAEAPPLMWADALDRMLGEFSASGIDCSRIRAIAGSAQQHGTVYLSADAVEQLGGLDPRRSLREQASSWFTRDRSPIWMDSSTSVECADITAALGGAASVGALTGSRAFERFAGPQIRKFAREQPEAYGRTARIHLVSSFLASLLAGADSPVDPGDASGMNLMDITTCAWAPAALRATAAGLETRLPAIVESWRTVGTLAPYWQQRYGFPPALVAAWSGDNPCSLVGAGVVREGQIAISLGTSDTVFGYMGEPRVDPSGTGHLFAAPTGDYMGLTCFRNGSLARERVRDAYGLDWGGFSEALRTTAPGNGGAIMVPWFDLEITPPVLRPGVHRFGLNPDHAAGNVRAVVEGQAMAMRLHSRWMGVPVERIRAVGGASANRDILQVLADVFGATVHPPAAGNAAALGAALRAWHAHEHAHGRDLPWVEITAAFVQSRREGAIRPRPEHQATYARLLERYSECETRALHDALSS